jgi:hypothetical protein
MSLLTTEAIVACPCRPRAPLVLFDRGLGPPQAIRSSADLLRNRGPSSTSRRCISSRRFHDGVVVTRASAPDQQQRSLPPARVPEGSGGFLLTPLTQGCSGGLLHRSEWPAQTTLWAYPGIGASGSSAKSRFVDCMRRSQRIRASRTLRPTRSSRRRSTQPCAASAIE